MQFASDTYNENFLPEKEENREIIRQSLYVEYTVHKNKVVVFILFLHF